jgi:hypothetical protein
MGTLALFADTVGYDGETQKIDQDGVGKRKESEGKAERQAEKEDK